MKYRNFLIHAVIFSLLLCIGVSFLQDKMELKKSYVKYDEFFELEGPIDVFFLGSSHIINAIYLDTLYADYGITSYNLANHGELVPTSYWVLRNAVEYHKPKLVVIDLFSVAQNGAYYNSAFSHISLDAFPLTVTKLKAINDMFLDIDTKAEFLNNLYLYHTRWKDGKELFQPYLMPDLKGAELSIGISTEIENISAGKIISEEDTDGIKYLIKMVEFCEENNIEIMATNLPYSDFKERDGVINYAIRLLREKGIPVLDFRNDDSLVNIKLHSDFRDTHHLNPLGGMKITKYLGDYISQNYSLDDYRKSDVSEYDEGLLSTMQNMEEIIKTRGYLSHALLLLKAFEYEGVLVIPSHIISDEAIAVNSLLRIDDKTPINKSDEIIEGCYVEILGDDAKENYAQVYYESSILQTPYGYLDLQITEEGISCTLNDKEKQFIENQEALLYAYDDNDVLFLKKYSLK